MAKIKGAVEVDIERCKGCELCVKTCPFGVLSMSNEVNMKSYSYAYMQDPDSCTGCTSCGLVCPDGCIKVYKIKA